MATPACSTALTPRSQAKIDSFTKDLQTVSSRKVKKVGENQLTLLIDAIAEAAAEHPPYVLKATNPGEIAASCFFHQVATEARDPLFRVPLFLGFTNTGEMHDLERSFACTFPQLTTVKTACAALSPETPSSPFLSTEYPCMMKQARINGKPLCEFLCSKEYYQLEISQKVALFQNLGSLALFDFVIGNTDRLVQVGPEQDTFIFLEGANLDNVMRDSQGLWAIDNVVRPSFFETPEEHERYLTFITTHLQSEHFISSFTAHMKKAIIAALQESSGERTCLKQLQGSSSKDTEHVSTGKILDLAIQIGILTMQDLLQTNIIQNWESNPELHNRLDSIQPGFSAVISRQYTAFQKALIRRKTTDRVPAIEQLRLNLETEIRAYTLQTPATPGALNDGTRASTPATPGGAYRPTSALGSPYATKAAWRPKQRGTPASTLLSPDHFATSFAGESSSLVGQENGAGPANRSMSPLLLGPPASAAAATAQKKA